MLPIVHIGHMVAANLSGHHPGTHCKPLLTFENAI